ncbi:MAG: DUF6691 family protein, partial [Bacteroidota bacterium]
AVVAGALIHLFIKRAGLKSLDGQPIQIADKPNTFKASLFGGSLFGLGWAMTGACPGPLYTLVGHGYWVILVVIGSALLGTLSYGALKQKLPH